MVLNHSSEEYDVFPKYVLENHSFNNQCSIHMILYRLPWGKAVGKLAVDKLAVGKLAVGRLADEKISCMIY